MEFIEKKNGKYYVLTPQVKRLDAHQVPAFREKINASIAGGDVFILLNLSELEFIDSSGLGAIISSLKMLEGKGEVSICGSRPSITDMFRLTKMDKVFRMAESEKEILSTEPQANQTP